MEKKVFIAIAGLMCFAAIGGSGNDVAAQESEDVRPLVVMTKMEKTSRGEEANDSDAVTFDRLLFWHLLYSAMDTLMQEDAEARCFIMVMYNKSGVVNAAGIDNERAYEGRDALREMSRPMSLCQMHLPLTLAALSTGKVNEKTVVDVSGGIYEEGDTLLARDHNWHRGGYGSLTTSHIGTGRPGVTAADDDVLQRHSQQGTDDGTRLGSGGERFAVANEKDDAAASFEVCREST